MLIIDSGYDVAMLSYSEWIHISMNSLVICVSTLILDERVTMVTALFVNLKIFRRGGRVVGECINAWSIALMHGQYLRGPRRVRH